jgi:hypothetical protein
MRQHKIKCKSINEKDLVVSYYVEYDSEGNANCIIDSIKDDNNKNYSFADLDSKEIASLNDYLDYISMMEDLHDRGA